MGQYSVDLNNQERVANDRQRPVENRWIGQRVGNPPVGLAAIAPVDAGMPVLVDVQMRPGYAPSMSAGMTQSAD